MIELPILVTNGDYTAVITDCTANEYDVITEFKMIITSTPLSQKKMIGKSFDHPTTAIKHIYEDPNAQSGWYIWKNRNNVNLLDIYDKCLPAAVINFPLKLLFIFSRIFTLRYCEYHYTIRHISFS